MTQNHGSGDGPRPQTNNQVRGLGKKRQRARNLELYGEIIRGLYVDKGLSQAEIGRTIGFSQAAIGEWLKALGVEIRPSWRSGDENGRYKDGTESRAYRKLVEIDKCNRCGSTEQLLVHHQNGDHMDNDPGNLEVLCSPCHSRYHKSAYWASRPRKTHCLRGHPLSGDNLNVNAKGHHSCKTCAREASRRYEARQRRS
jgi:hypothetical protein